MEVRTRNTLVYFPITQPIDNILRGYSPWLDIASSIHFHTSIQSFLYKNLFTVQAKFLAVFILRLRPEFLLQSLFTIQASEIHKMKSNEIEMLHLNFHCHI